MRPKIQTLKLFRKSSIFSFFTNVDNGLPGVIVQTCDVQTGEAPAPAWRGHAHLEARGGQTPREVSLQLGGVG